MIDARPTLAGAMAELVTAVDRVARDEGVAHVVVPGGRSPTRLFAALRDTGTIDARWRPHLADERCVPIDDARRNGPAVARALGLDDHGAPTTLHAPTTIGREGAEAYAAELALVPRFAAVVLGVGADGHVASVFPGVPDALEADTDALVVAGPDGGPDRITMSVPRLSRTDLVVLVVDGEDKEWAIAAVEDGAAIPANAVVAPRRVLVDLRD